MTRETGEALISAALDALTAKARDLGVPIHTDTIATIANVLRPLLGFAQRFAVAKATITQSKRPTADQRNNLRSRQADDEHNDPTL